MVYGCGCVVVGKPNPFMTFAEMRLWIWWSFQLEGNTLVANGYLRIRWMHNEWWRNTKLDW